MTPANWKPIVYCSVILAIKFLEDCRYWNKDIVDYTMLYDLKETNYFEHLFINAIDFNLYIEPSITESYFKWLTLYKKLILSPNESKSGPTVDKVMSILESW